MKTILKIGIFALVSSVFPAVNSYAIDFDQDGFDDFVLININAKNRLEWFAIDINDPVKRPLGIFGKAGEHVAVGSWFGNNTTSKALIKKKDDGNFEWNLQLSGGQKSLLFGSYPDLVISGFDSDKNGAIDPATVTTAGKKLVWKIMPNAGVGGQTVMEYKFGAKRDIPYYSNTDGTGDKICTASAKRNTLSLRCLNLSNQKIKTTNIKDFNTKISSIHPVSLPNGKDILFIVSEKGKRINVSLIKGNKKFKSIRVKGDEVVVGRYLGGTAEELVVRSGEGKAIFIDTKGKKSILNLNLDGVLADEVNINSFKNTGSGGKPQPQPSPVATQPGSSPTPPAQNPGTNPSCAGTAISTEHLLYKPVSDTTGNAVIVFDSKYAREFLSVKIQLKDGTFAEAWWKGLELWGNPDSFGPRQHWRTNVRATQVKDGALIIAEDLAQECKFVLPGSSTQRWE
jgi:hypothetical protein